MLVDSQEIWRAPKTPGGNRAIGTPSEHHVVTGAFSYTGRYITQKLLAMGKNVRTLTRDPGRRNPFGDQISVAPFRFDDRPALIDSLQGASTLYNTYWVRFGYAGTTFDQAIANTRTLFQAAQEAGVQKIVHISVTNADEQSPLPYFRGKGLVERLLRESSLSYAIVRPTLVFGVDDILLNNIAWFLKHFPVFVIPGTGDYQLQPVFVGDVADIAVGAAAVGDSLTIDAAGLDVYTFRELVELLAQKAKRRIRLIHAGSDLTIASLRLMGYLVHDVILTRDELRGLMLGLLLPSGSPTGPTRLSAWLDDHAAALGTHYTSEITRNYR